MNKNRDKMRRSLPNPPFPPRAHYNFQRGAEISIPGAPHSSLVAMSQEWTVAVYWYLSDCLPRPAILEFIAISSPLSSSVALTGVSGLAGVQRINPLANDSLGPWFLCSNGRTLLLQKG